jgi:uncharacterized protein YcbK (DUF882 family)
MNRYHRRDVLKIGAAVLVGSLLPFPALAALSDGLQAPRRLAFYNIHTAESVDVCYYREGAYLPEALDKINYVLRDFRRDAIKPIDPNLLDVVHAVKCRIGRDQPFHLISGYRTPRTNEMLRRTTTGVARHSFHTMGRAIDIRLPGYCTRRLRQACVKMQSGGVGYYPKSDFVHVDTGSVRTW